MKDLNKLAEATATAKVALEAEAKRLFSPEVLVCLERDERFSWVDKPGYMHMSIGRFRMVLKDHLVATAKAALAEIDPSLRLTTGLLTDVKDLASDIIAHVHAHNSVEAIFDQIPGYDRGVANLNGSRILIRKPLRPVCPKKGPWKHLKEFFETAMGKGHDEPHWKDQYHAFCCVLRAKMYQMLSEGPNRSRGSCPLLVFVGDPADGKSLAAELLGSLFGGSKPLDPSAEINGWTDALLNSSVLCYDEASREDFSYGEGQSRQRFTEFFKRLEFSAAPSIATRGKKALVIPAHWLWLRLLNLDSRAALNQTPVPDENGMEDKLVMIRFHRGKVPLAGKEGPNDRKERWEILEAELAGFAHWLLHEFEPRRELITREDNTEYRNQCHPFVHPEVLRLVKGSENDATRAELLRRFLILCRGEPFHASGKKWRASQIYSTMQRRSVEEGCEAAKVALSQIKSAEALGLVLSNACTANAGWVRKSRKQGSNLYSFTLPTPDDEKATSI